MQAQAQPSKTTIEEIDYAEAFQEFITLNDDVEIDEALKTKIINANKTELLKITKIIGSTPIKIQSVELYNEEFLLNNF